MIAIQPATGTPAHVQPAIIIGSANRLLMATLPLQAVRPRSTWTPDRYRTALTALADLHATWWGLSSNPAAYPWAWLPIGHDADRILREARSSLVEIKSAHWGDRFLAPKQIDTWLRVVDDPSRLLDMLIHAPYTLIHGDYWAGSVGGSRTPHRQGIGVGPAWYELACFYSSARWQFGRLPLTLAEMRNHYLQHLNNCLEQPIDRYLFDVGVDASRAWGFLTYWPDAISENAATLLASARHLRSTVIEPAFASLRRAVL